MNEDEVRQDAVRYVEDEADTEVLKIEFAEKFTHWGHEQFIYGVQTTDEIGEWWVVAGETGTNLYPKEQFSNPDYVFSFHTGVMDRIIEKQVKSSPGTVGDKRFDVFICHASEDKDEFVEPLARILDQRGLHVWYDEFQLTVGDSLRESIDEGLSQSHFGAVVLSEAFFEKDWTQYELNGLTAREIGDESVILPIWYRVGRDDVLEYSPSLADRVAITTDGNGIEQTAEELTSAITSTLRKRLS